ncbi:hypothetical protein L2E82_01428 [Cichorium intybus]|uniref:Uncharacterized protein n=1 Tax=Cichorium intybus TaxID=13427 RepID=A0ACB9H005_CICIN|nr:hypothetical protein L2E82_01428 [Cichorium intybus]
MRLLPFIILCVIIIRVDTVSSVPLIIFSLQYPPPPPSSSAFSSSSSFIPNSKTSHPNHLRNSIKSISLMKNDSP